VRECCGYRTASRASRVVRSRDQVWHSQGCRRNHVESLDILHLMVRVLFYDAFRRGREPQRFFLVCGAYVCKLFVEACMVYIVVSSKLALLAFFPASPLSSFSILCLSRVFPSFWSPAASGNWYFSSPPWVRPSRDFYLNFPELHFLPTPPSYPYSPPLPLPLSISSPPPHPLNSTFPP